MGSKSSNQVLSTKLQPPDLPNDFVIRDNLLDYVNQDIERHFTLVSAGAGFGKSTFVSSWFSGLSSKTGWLSLDEYDNDLRTFLIHFVAAIQKSYAAFGQEISSLLQVPQLPGLSLLRTTLINNLNDLSENVILALDDFHLINNKEVTLIIAEILKFPPKNFHLVIITRSDPQLPLTRLRGRNKIKDIRSSHLRLKEKELIQFIKSNLNTEDVDLIARSLETKLEGWFTGIRLALMHLSFHDLQKESIKEIIEGVDLSETYLLEEVINHLDDFTLDFLLKTSILRKFNSELADYLFSYHEGSSLSQVFISNLLRKNLFIINLDNKGEWFRYHHLFHALLKKELRKRIPVSSQIELHKKAIKWHEEKGLIEDALFHALQINDKDVLVSLIEKHMYTPLNDDRWYVLEQWLKNIPSHLIYKSPTLLIAQIWVLHHKNIMWAIPEFLAKFDKIQKSSSLDKDIRLQADIFHGVTFFWESKIKKCMHLFDRARKNLSKEKIAAISLASVYYGVASQMNGTGKEVYKEYESTLCDTSLNSTYWSIVSGALIYMKLLEGDLFMAKRIAKRLYDYSSKTKDDFIRTWALYFLGYVAFQQNKQEEAKSYFREALNSVYFLNMSSPIDSFAGMLLSLQLLKSKEEYNQVYQELLSFIQEMNNPFFTSIAYTLRARLASQEGDIKSAKKFIKMTDLNFALGNVLYEIEIPSLTRCRVLLAEGTLTKIGEAYSILQEQLILAKANRNVPFQIQTLVLLTIAYIKMNDMKSAADALVSALEKARPGQWIYPFIESGAELHDILLSICLNDIDIKDFASNVLSELQGVDSEHNDATKDNKNISHQVGPLTNRELDILSLLAKRLSNKEIANKLFISESTVKRHTISIYAKLNVHKRREAAVKASLMGLI